MSHFLLIFAHAPPETGWFDSLNLVHLWLVIAGEHPFGALHCCCTLLREASPTSRGPSSTGSGELRPYPDAEERSLSVDGLVPPLSLGHVGYCVLRLLRSLFHSVHYWRLVIVHSVGDHFVIIVMWCTKSCMTPRVLCRSSLGRLRFKGEEWKGRTLYSAYGVPVMSICYPYVPLIH